MESGVSLEQDHDYGEFILLDWQLYYRYEPFLSAGKFHLCSENKVNLIRGHPNVERLRTALISIFIPVRFFPYAPTAKDLLLN